MNFKLNLKSFLIGVGSLVISYSAMASTATDAMMDKLKKSYPNIAFTHVNETHVPGIYEAVFGKELLYVESSGTYFFPTMVNMVTKVNLGELRLEELNKIDFADLPLADAVKTVKGNGSRKMAVFADPNCGYCKKLEVQLDSIKDVTIYTFVLGILGSDSVSKASAINAAGGDRAKVWRAAMIDGTSPITKADPASALTTEKNLALFKKFNFQGTPAIVFQNGSAIKGYAEAPRIDEMLAKK